MWCVWKARLVSVEVTRPIVSVKVGKLCFNLWNAFNRFKDDIAFKNGLQALWRCCGFGACEIKRRAEKRVLKLRCPFGLCAVATVAAVVRACHWNDRVFIIWAPLCFSFFSLSFPFRFPFRFLLPADRRSMTQSIGKCVTLKSTTLIHFATESPFIFHFTNTH